MAYQPLPIFSLSPINRTLCHPVPSHYQVLQGYYLTHQTTNCVFPAFKEIQEPSGAHLAEIDDHTPDARVFRNYAGPVQE